jgi:hypothetical protein
MTTPMKELESAACSGGPISFTVVAVDDAAASSTLPG